MGGGSEGGACSSRMRRMRRSSSLAKVRDPPWPGCRATVGRQQRLAGALRKVGARSIWQRSAFMASTRRKGDLCNSAMRACHSPPVPDRKHLTSCAVACVSLSSPATARGPCRILKGQVPDECGGGPGPGEESGEPAGDQPRPPAAAQPVSPTPAPPQHAWCLGGGCARCLHTVPAL